MPVQLSKHDHLTQTGRHELPCNTRSCIGPIFLWLLACSENVQNDSRPTVTTAGSPLSKKIFDLFHNSPCFVKDSGVYVLNP